MRYLLIALLFFSCQKDGIFAKEPPILTIEVQFSIPYTSQVILTGNVSEVCYRGFMVSYLAGSKITDSGIAVLPYDKGTGKFQLPIGLESGKIYYVKAWGYREDISNIGYSKEQSFKAY